MLLPYDVIVLLISFLIAAVAIRPDSPRYLRYFPVYLALTSIVEIIGATSRRTHVNNALMYNLSSTARICFFIFVAAELLRGKPAKLAGTFLRVFPVLALLNICFVQGPHHFHTYSYMLGCVLIDILGILYFVQLFNQPEPVELAKLPAFWIMIGFIFYFTCSMSFLGLANYISSLPRTIRFQLVNLLSFINTLLYILFDIAFLCQLNTRKFMSNS
ncbi:MAG: hypothetical protein JO301_10440 [Chitinophagaceae bacterium]|nr:hypothetical protein [Chitinophagaceae bacterium]